MKTKNIYLIRHGQTNWNLEKRFQGKTDIPLNEEGKQQAVALIPAMSQYKIEMAYSSYLSRAVETAHLALQDLKMNPIKDERLNEANIGEAEGLTIDELHQRFGVSSVERWRSYEERDLDFKYPNGESKRQLMIRARQAMLEIAQTSSAQNIAVFAHGMVMRALTFAFKQGVAWDVNIFANGSIHQFVWEEKRSEYLKYQGRIN